MFARYASFLSIRKVLYFLLSVIGWGGSLALIIVMFVKFDGCDLSKFFVAFTLCLAVLTTLLSRTWAKAVAMLLSS